ncbi:hypothetical protein ACFSTC_21330 [Nonomuraea ferruginea]
MIPGFSGSDGSATPAAMAVRMLARCPGPTSRARSICHGVKACSAIQSGQRVTHSVGVR